MPKGKRPPVETDEHLLMDRLRDLQVRLSHTSDKEDSMNIIEFYDLLVRGKESGRACAHATKSILILKKYDLKDIKQHLSNVVECIRKVDDSNFLK